MKTKKTITKPDLINAHHAKKVITPAIDALSKINIQSVNFDAFALEKVEVFTRWLEIFTEKADAVITQANELYAERDQSLINVAHRRLCMIPDAITIHEKAALSLATTYQGKLKELAKQGFSPAQSEQIIPDPQPEIDNHNQAIVDLHLETKQISAYLADSPRFDAKLLPKSLSI